MKTGSHRSKKGVKEPSQTGEGINLGYECGNLYSDEKRERSLGQRRPVRALHAAPAMRISFLSPVHIFRTVITVPSSGRDGTGGGGARRGRGGGRGLQARCSEPRRD
jgi:hypothetical protein